MPEDEIEDFIDSDDGSITPPVRNGNHNGAGDHFIDEENEDFAYSAEDLQEGNEHPSPSQEPFIIRRREEADLSAL